jgi:hypothetical protein
MLGSLLGRADPGRPAESAALGARRRTLPVGLHGHERGGGRWREPGAGAQRGREGPSAARGAGESARRYVRPAARDGTAGPEQPVPTVASAAVRPTVRHAALETGVSRTRPGTARRQRRAGRAQWPTRAAGRPESASQASSPARPPAR